jgi:hypothetical protein
MLLQLQWRTSRPFTVASKTAVSLGQLLTPLTKAGSSDNVALFRTVLEAEEDFRDDFSRQVLEPVR